ncbi:hypothetical protein K1T35_48230 (plasmid) [Pseudonocardia sp. DSM 110487]|uniref:hypothetical protein n=1 Tax=Pseudonocardia sp. DSM 110487 TaxID=2865833 RepID=UPI001C6A726F|nr:hypothetical protein [Pseudonocardia sp. DSM 110487]QYN41137.1 hypothetical protein K1T35_48230 [Pseudonocardia sp. DSM 110487]
MSYGWGPNLHESRRRVRELAVKLVLENGESLHDAAMRAPGVTIADVADWVKEAQNDADSAVPA